jgi:hypothetical protein
MKDFPLVEVEWLDAWFERDEQTIDDMKDDEPITLVGYLVRDNPRLVSVAQEWLRDDDNFRATTHIPRSLVVRITPLARRDLDGPAF